MTDNSEREFLATQVMKYTLDCSDQKKHPSNPCRYLDKDGKFVCLDYLFDPRNNIEQAFKLFDGFDYAMGSDAIRQGDNQEKYWCDVWPKGTAEFSEGYGESQLDAIVNSLLQAYNWKCE